MQIKISELLETLNLDDNSVFPVVFQGDTRKVNFSTLKKWLNSSDIIKGYYDEKSKSIILVLADEQTISIAIGDIVADYYTKTDSDNAFVKQVDGKGLSTNDFDNNYKNKIDGIDIGANKTIVDSALNINSSNPVSNSVIVGALSEKVDVVEGKSLTTNDLTNDLKAKYDGALDDISNIQKEIGDIGTYLDLINGEEI
jgi:hypothetical protein